MRTDVSVLRLCTGCLLPLCWVAALAAEAIDFNRDIRPILSDRCYLCHGRDAAAREANLRLDVREDALRTRGAITPIVPGDLEKSEVLRRVYSADPAERMPPPASNFFLSAEEKARLTEWIRAGAPYDRHWAFKPIGAPGVPTVEQEDWVRTPIDAFVLSKLAARQESFTAEAPKERLIRRVCFDLTGLPPTLAEIDAFLDDRSPRAYEALVDELLQRKTYGERMTSEWLDVARYADTYGYQVDRDRRVWPWRDWVIDAFNQNLPYDTFVLWQLAGDLLPSPSREQILATTFNRLHPQKVEGGSVPEEFRVEYVSDRTHTFGTAFLGLTLECARCHDHKYDPIEQREYYELTAFFANIDEAGLYSYFTNSVPPPTLALSTEGEAAALDAAQAEVVREEARLAATHAAHHEALDRWLRERPSQLALSGEIGRFAFDSLQGGRLENDLDPNAPAKTSAANVLTEGRWGRGLQLSGDDEVKLKIGNFRRWEPFTIALWIKSPDLKKRAVVFHRSRAWTDAGSRGYQLLIEEGRLSASLIHFWPGNAIRIRTESPIATEQWVHVAMSYDGSSRAEGLNLFVDGAEAACEVVRDHLYKNISGGGNDHLIIGARFRDQGFSGGIVDEFRVFDRQLTPWEIRGLVESTVIPGHPPADLEGDALKHDTLAHHDAEYRAQLQRVRQVRQTLCEIQDKLVEIMVMAETESPRETYLLDRGAYDQRRERVHADTPAALPPFPDEFPRNRLGLARWLTHPDHPLLARVTVNRYWQMFFGNGLVKSSNNFGSQGTPPTHPALLDWLAHHFVSSGWDVKALMKVIVTSAVYRQDSTVSAERLRRDPENRWLSRGPRYRLPAEMIRDNVLAASGLLVHEVGGPPARPYEVAVSFKPVKRDKGQGLYRRSLYTYWKRTGPAPVMMALDAAKRDVCSVKREPTSTPLQSFIFMNDPQFVEAARRLAAVALQSSDRHSSAALEHLFRVLTSRRPSDAEKTLLQGLYQAQLSAFDGDPQRAEAFLSVGDAPRDEAIPAPMHAAMTVVANTLMSYDECIVKR